MGMKMKRKQLWKPLLGLVMMGTAVVVLAVQSFAEQDTIPAITWVTTASEESAESEPQIEPLETEADSENANRQPVFDWDKPTKAETTTKSAGSTTAPVRQTEPAQPDAAELAFPEEAEPEISYPLDLNAATAEELETLPGVGAILAERIVSYREAVGGFQTLEELQQVNGIGSGIYSQIAPYLFIIGELQTISPESELPEATDAAAPELEPETAPESASASIPRLDINIATAEDFQKLPNVTQEQAEAIVRLRTQIQYFQNIYELLYADGMTDRLFLSIRDYLYVSFA